MALCNTCGKEAGFLYSLCAECRAERDTPKAIGDSAVKTTKSYCARCATAVAEDAKFCNNCGNSLQSIDCAAIASHASLSLGSKSPMIVTLRVLRVVFVVVGLWQIVGLFPVVTWLSNPAAITLGMVGIVVFKAVVGGICAEAFYWLGRLEQKRLRSTSRPNPSSDA